MSNINNLNLISNPIYDVIIIGAGMGGLIAGNILQKKGYKVLMLEKNDYPGGYCASFQRKDFNFDVNIHWLCGCEKGGIFYNILKKFSGENCVKFIKIKDFYQWIDQHNNISFRASTTLSEYIETLVKAFPLEEAQIREYFNLYGNFLDPIVIKRLSNKRVYEIINTHFSNPVLKNAILAPLGFFGWPPEESSALFMVAFSMMHFYQGAYYVKGGSGNFSKTLANIFVNNGGTISYETSVIKVLLEGKKVSGVIVEDKEKNKKEFSSQLIIGNNYPLMLTSSLTSKGEFPSDYVENIKNREPSLSAINLYLGLDVDLKDYNISDYMIWTPLHRNQTEDDLKMSLETVDYSKLPIGSITIYSNIDPSCCPDGKSVISMLCYAKIDPFEKIFNSKDGNNDEYNLLKTRISEQLIETISNVLKIPDLKTHIEVMELATPITFARFSNNPSGSIMGWLMTPEQFVQKPLFQKTPIENLFLCGQWVSRTGGLPSVAKSAEAASKLAMKYLKKKAKQNVDML